MDAGRRLFRNRAGGGAPDRAPPTAALASTLKHDGYCHQRRRPRVSRHRGNSMNLLREMEEEGRIRVAKGGHTPVRFGRNNWLMSSSIWKLMKLSVKAAQENA